MTLGTVFQTRGRNELRPAGGEATRTEVRRAILTGSVSYEDRGGYIRVRAARSSPVHIWASEYGECGDASCSCYRLKHPIVRSSFRNLVITRTADVLQESMAEGREGVRVRYVSIGCGRLLTDFEILCGLVEKGLPIESIVLCDTAYASIESYRHVFERLAGFIDAAHLAVFSSIDALERALRASPKSFGLASAFVHCDAEDIRTEKSEDLAKLALAEGGMLFRLHNNGFGTRKMWRLVNAALMPMTVLSAWEAPIIGPRDVAITTAGTRLFRVQHSRVVVRAHPRGPVRSLRHHGDELVIDDDATRADARSEGGKWVRLHRLDPSYMQQRALHADAPNTSPPSWTQTSTAEEAVEGSQEEQAWVCVDGREYGFGSLLEEVELFKNHLDKEERVAKEGICMAASEDIGDVQPVMIEESTAYEYDVSLSAAAPTGSGGGISWSDLDEDEMSMF